MTLTQLEYVLAVNEFRHFNKAAKSCHVTQPTLSMQLQKLEEELGVIIFDRSKNPIVPTEDGLGIIKQAKSVIKEAKGVWAVVNSTKEELEGDLTIAVIPTLAAYIIPLFLGEFKKKFPKVNLVIEESKTENIISSIEDDKIDAGLLVTPLYHDQILERALYYEKFMVFASEKHPYLKKSKIKEQDLNYEDIWLLNEGHCFRDQVLRICGLNGMKTRENLLFESGNLETLKNLVIKMGGYTFLPEMAVEGLASHQKKFVKEFCNPIPYREVSLVHGRLFHKERFLQALEDTILECLPNHYKSPKKSHQIIDI